MKTKYFLFVISTIFSLIANAILDSTQDAQNNKVPIASTVLPTSVQSTVSNPNNELASTTPSRSVETATETSPKNNVFSGEGLLNSTVENIASKTTSTTTVTTTTERTAINVTTDGNKIIQLPQDSVVLHAYATPELDNYDFDWHLVHEMQGLHKEQQDGSQTDTYTLSGLTAGLYEFKVEVRNEDAYGESYVNVTVQPPPRVNKPPVAVITVTDNVLTLPTDSTVLDGASSTDDDEIVRYEWSLESGPLDADNNIELQNVKTLQLTGLKVGEYTYKLTVTDSDGATNSTTTHITVKNRIDNPPIANAGPSKIITLPEDMVILCGNLSTDDWGIKHYEWSLSPDSKNEVADMKGAREKCVTLSKLQAGQYTLQLTVTDELGQMDTSKVTVLVQPETNKKPNAVAGDDVELLLPLDGGNAKTILDGSKSSDDKGIVSQMWTFTKGPSGGTATISSPTELKTSVSGLEVIGDYLFTLVVTDIDGSSDADQVIVTLKAEQPPTANAGPDITITLPDNFVVLNGSLSTDDYGIVKYEWTRGEDSPASGYTLYNSDHEKVAYIGGLIVGTYTYVLTVTNERGKSASDEAKVIVKPDAVMDKLVELHLLMDAVKFTEAKKNIVIGQLKLIMSLNDDDAIIVRNVYQDTHTSNLVILFYVTEKGKALDAGKVLETLNSKLKSGSMLLDYKVVQVDTHVCENTCSNHGRCHEGSKKCECDPFWMENSFRVAFGDGQSNCEWSVLYVGIAGFLILAIVSSFIWFSVCYCVSRKRNRRRRKNYSDMEKRRYEKLPMKSYKNGHVKKNGIKPPLSFKSNIVMQSLSSTVSSSDDDEIQLFERKKLLSSSSRKPNRVVARQRSPQSNVSSNGGDNEVYISRKNSYSTAVLRLSNEEDNLI